MDIAAFTASKAGTFAKTAEGAWAFVPSPLPPSIVPSWKMAQILAEANQNLGELAGVGLTLPNPHLLIRPFIQREAVLSSKIEGTQASHSDLLIFEAGEATEEAEAKSPDVREVHNYVKALEHGLSRLDQLPMSLRLIRETHRILMEGVRGENKLPGEFRDRQNWIAPGKRPITQATYVPPPVKEMHKSLDRFEKFLHDNHELPALVRLALAHYQFEAVHPFIDGNGRLGRLLITLQLCAEKLLRQPLLYLSAYFEKNRLQYYEMLLDVSRKGNWQDWIIFFLTGVKTQAKDALKRAQKLVALRDRYRQKLQESYSSSSVLILVDNLFAYPAITIPRAAKILNLTFRGAQLNLKKLITENILEEVTGKTRGRIFMAKKIVKIIQEDEA